MAERESIEVGEKLSLQTSALDVGASLVQDFSPIKNICVHLCSFPHYVNEPSKVSHINEDVMQCLMYDSNEESGKLFAIEYIVSDKVFSSLPEDEKKLWHSHEYEVKNGLMFLPRMPEQSAKSILEKLSKSYGKVWNLWQVDKGDPLPLGSPKLMSGPLEDGEVSCSLLKAVEERYKFKTSNLKEQREDLKGPQNGIDSAANSWKKSGKSLDCVVCEGCECQEETTAKKSKGSK